MSRTWDEIRDEWKGPRGEIESFPSEGKWSGERLQLIQELARLECFIEKCWPAQAQVIEVIRAERKRVPSQEPF
jgi:hypothetical protein